MDIVKIKKKNETFLQITTEPAIYYELHEHFSFLVDGYKFMPAYKAGVWDGRKKLFDLKAKTLYIGLYNELVEFCEARQYTVELEDSPAFGLPGEEQAIDIEDVSKFIQTLDVRSKGEPLECRDYQLEAIYESIKSKRLVCLSPTASGKSFIIYCIVRWMLLHDHDVLIIVPTIGLVTQMSSDFKDYGSHNGFDSDAAIHQIMGGKEKKTNKPIVISTYQSLQSGRVNPEWLNRFDVVCVDECHTAKAAEISKIMELSTNVPYRFGFTGSLDRSTTNKMVLQGLFGKVIRLTTTRKLMDQGHISDLKIKCLMLNYSKDTKKLFKTKQEYSNEIDFLVTHDRRNKFIRNLAVSLEGNTLLLFTRVEHGKALYESILEKAGDRKVHLVYGGTDVDDREQVRTITEESKNSIIVASFGVFSTGVNIKKLHNLIFASPTKSIIRVLQSIGRGLRNSADKEFCTLYDISDRLGGSKTKPNHTFNHFAERLKIYNEEAFEYKLVEVEIE